MVKILPIRFRNYLLKRKIDNHNFSAFFKNPQSVFSLFSPHLEALSFCKLSGTRLPFPVFLQVEMSRQPNLPEGLPSKHAFKSKKTTFRSGNSDTGLTFSF
jgi:hypothetical protein